MMVVTRFRDANHKPRGMTLFLIGYNKLVCTSLSNSPHLESRPCLSILAPISMALLPDRKSLRAALLLVLCVLPGALVISSPAQTQQTRSIEFKNITTAAGIKFVHFKGNSG